MPARLFSAFWLKFRCDCPALLATLKMWQINPRLWLLGYLQSCATAGGQAPTDIQPFLPWNLSPTKRAELAIESPPHKTDSG